MLSAHDIARARPVLRQFNLLLLTLLAGLLVGRALPTVDGSPMLEAPAWDIMTEPATDLLALSLSE